MRQYGLLGLLYVSIVIFLLDSIIGQVRNHTQLLHYIAALCLSGVSYGLSYRAVSSCPHVITLGTICSVMNIALVGMLRMIPIFALRPS